jgi:mannose-6-phosphate isomerase
VGLRRLPRRHVERIWGRRDLSGPFAPPPGARAEPIGEIWFEGAPGAELLVKYLFTAERLSIQVHPDDAAARAAGYPRGKDEAWVILAAEPDATIALGTKQAMSKDALRAASLDGSIEQLLDWKPVRTGDFYYSPAGTIHAIGGGLALIEVQQHLDLTYRLYDYGRPRELHLDEAVAVADPAPWTPSYRPAEASPGRNILAAGGAFVLERWTRAEGIAAHVPDGTMLVPLAGDDAGSVWAADGPVELAGPLDLLAAYPGGAVRDLEPAA